MPLVKLPYAKVLYCSQLGKSQWRAIAGEQEAYRLSFEFLGLQAHVNRAASYPHRS